MQVLKFKYADFSFIYSFANMFWLHDFNDDYYWMFAEKRCLLSTFWLNIRFWKYLAVISVLLSCPIAISKDFLNNVHLVILSLCLWMTSRQNFILSLATRQNL